MPARLQAVFAAGILICFALGGCRTRATTSVSVEDDKKAVIDVVLAHELACQTYDFDKVDALHTPDARGMQESYPQPTEPVLRQGYQPMKDAGIRIDYHPQDLVAQVRGDVAWVTVTLRSVWTADTPAGLAMLGTSRGYETFVESFVLVRTPAGWKIALGHSSALPPDFGVEADYQQLHGGMKFAKVADAGAAATAGFKPGDVLVEYGGRKIDNPGDFDRLRYDYYVGEKVPVIVMRGKEKIAEAVTLQALR